MTLFEQINLYNHVRIVLPNMSYIGHMNHRSVNIRRQYDQVRWCFRVYFAGKALIWGSSACAGRVYCGSFEWGSVVKPTKNERAWEQKKKTKSDGWHHFPMKVLESCYDVRVDPSIYPYHRWLYIYIFPFYPFKAQ